MKIFKYRLLKKLIRGFTSICCGVAGRAWACKPVSVGSKASGSRSQSGSDATIISRCFSNAVHVYSLHSLERVAQWAKAGLSESQMTTLKSNLSI